MARNVVVALGSNIGCREYNITKALRCMVDKGLTLKKTARLYESAPEYVEDQPAFLNTVIVGTTSRSAEGLLEDLKSIEKQMGRDFSTIRNGPRCIDLDIIFYDNVEFSSENLTIPHEACHTRRFVMQPLCDIAPEWYHPVKKLECKSLLESLPSPQLRSVYSLGRGAKSLRKINDSTVIMGILNATPDSFSDGGLHNDLSRGASRALEMVKEGAEVIDIGGESTRPGSVPVTVDEEIARTVPLIQRLRAEGVEVPISIDTTKSEVARAAIEAGASFINDISGATFDPNMLRTAFELEVPICLMHFYGTDTATMQNNISYPNDDAVGAINRFLEERVAAAMATGIPRWNIMVDPGIGFGKEMRHNLEILRHIDSFSVHQCPILVGSSRKGFIGTITRVTDKASRIMGTAATYGTSIAQGADIIRVHDVLEMKQFADMCDAIHRPAKPEYIRQQ